MARKLKFSFPLPTLLHEGDAICDAAEAKAAALAKRLPAAFVTGTRSLLDAVSGQNTAQKSGAGGVGSLTKEQNEKLAKLEKLMAAAKATAKKAFRGQAVKLREQFQVSADQPKDLASVLARARIIEASCRETAAALQAKGWLAADTQKLAGAVAALDSADDTQETAKQTKKGTTADRNEQANELYERLLTIQNAADLEWPADVTGNEAVRGQFRLGTFPPKPPGKGQKGGEPPPTGPKPPAN